MSPISPRSIPRTALTAPITSCPRPETWCWPCSTSRTQRLRRTPTGVKGPSEALKGPKERRTGLRSIVRTPRASRALRETPLGIASACIGGMAVGGAEVRRSGVLCRWRTGELLSSRFVAIHQRGIGVRIAEARDRTALFVRSVKERTVRRGEELNSFVSCWRGSEPVALIEVSGGRDALVPVLHLAAVGFGADLLGLSNDTVMATEPTHPKRGFPGSRDRSRSTSQHNRSGRSGSPGRC